MGARAAPYCGTCRMGNHRRRDLEIQRVYTRMYQGKGYQPVGWLCTATGHLRLDVPAPRSPEADDAT